MHNGRRTAHLPFVYTEGMNRELIYCRKEALSRYLGLSENLDIAIHYLLTHDLSELKPGKNIIQGDAVFINRFEYDTETDPITEAHLRYTDIHAVLSGEETVATADIRMMTETERREDEDYIGLTGPFQCMHTMRAGDVLIAFPEDAHSPKRISGTGTCHVQKAVVKVLCDTGITKGA